MKYRLFYNENVEYLFFFSGRPTEIDESDVYVVESKVRGYEDGGKRCSLTGCKSSHYSSTKVANDCAVVSTNEQKISLKVDMDQLPSTAKTKTEDFHSNVPSTSKGIIEQSGTITKLGSMSASFSSISVDDDSSSGSNQAASTMRNTPISVDQEEAMNDAYAKKLKHSLKVDYSIL
ncbi:unnamed protein product [Onchocerca flexuosa]|uniref:C3H1-type domain-containing protein n=1 Tax=Onchocerca flexuosa TaxID=387005 RepID=A0A183I751_9BILA|nr:unnamed protein product [Onchocerca flexuosa]